jgi:hypothetical protein
MLLKAKTKLYQLPTLDIVRFNGLCKVVADVFVCVCCHEKKSEGQYIANGWGLCSYCHCQHSFAEENSILFMFEGPCFMKCMSIIVPIRSRSRQQYGLSNARYCRYSDMSS